MILSIIWPLPTSLLTAPALICIPQRPWHPNPPTVPQTLQMFFHACLPSLIPFYVPGMSSLILLANHALFQYSTQVPPPLGCCPQHPSPWDAYPSCLLSTHGTALPLFICYPHFLEDHKFPGGCSTFIFPLVFLAPNARALDILKWSRFGMEKAGYVGRSPQDGIYLGEFIVTQGLALSLKAWELGLTYYE